MAWIDEDNRIVIRTSTQVPFHVRRMIAPLLDEVATDYQGKLQVAKMNVDENREIPAKFGIRGIPTLMLFKNGNVEATKVGALSKSQLTAFVDSNL